MPMNFKVLIIKMATATVETAAKEQFPEFYGDNYLFIVSPLDKRHTRRVCCATLKAVLRLLMAAMRRQMCTPQIRIY